MAKSVYAIEGLDRLGKSTLIDGIRQKLGYYEVIHFSKPQKLKVYEHTNRAFIDGIEVPPESVQAFEYQRAGFLNSMLLARSGANIIFDRWHLGEVVYSPMYRGYSGEYVFQQELSSGLADTNLVRLILLVEDFKTSKHFVDDGHSLGPMERRKEEQTRFIGALGASNLRDKRIICVTNQDTGGFRDKADILKEALS